MGSYSEGDFALLNGRRIADLYANFNAPFIMDGAGRTFAGLGAVAGQWFSVECDISGASAHAEFSGANLPAPSAAGPFFFGVGISGNDAGAGGITQYIGDVTLRHRTDPNLNVVSAGSGFDEPAFASFGNAQSTRAAVPIAP